MTPYRVCARWLPLSPLLLVAALLTQARPAPAAAGAAWQERARSLLCTEAEARGERRSLFATWVEFARARPDSPLAGLALQMAAGLPLEDPKAMAGELRRLQGAADALACRPLYRDRLRQMQAARLQLLGKYEQARALARARGLVPRWSICGPFGLYPRSSFYIPFGPERKPDRDAVYDAGTLGGEARWRVLETGACLPRLFPWRQLTPTRGTVYLLARFRLPKAAKVVLHVESSASYVIFFDGVKRLRLDRLAREEARDALWGPLRLASGRHRLLVKAYAENNSAALVVRLLTDELTPLPGVSWGQDQAARVPVAPAPVAGGGERALALTRPGWLRELERAAGNDAGTAVLHAALARALRAQGCADEALWHARRAVELEPGNPWFQVELARNEFNAAHLAMTAREDNALRALHAAVRVRADFVPALMELARLYRDRRQPARAIALCLRALAANPGCTPAATLRAAVALRQRWYEEARAWERELRATAGDSLPALRLRVALARALGDYQGVERALEHAAGLYPGDMRTRLLFCEELLRQGRGDDAAGRLQRLAADGADSADLLVRVAAVLARAGRAKRAVALLRRVCASRPDLDRGWRLLGDLLYERKRPDAALAAYRQSLRARPDQHDLRRLLLRLRKRSPDYWKPYRVDPFAALARYKDHDSNAPTSRLVDLLVVNVYADGSCSSFTQELVKVQQRSGIGKARNVDVYGSLISARTILPDGRTLEPLRLAGRNRLTMPGVRQGSAVDCEYLDDTPAPAHRFFLFPKWYFRSPDKEEDFVFSRIVVRVPRGFPLAFAQRNCDRGVKFSQKREGERVVYSWTARNMPQALHEPDAPHIDELLPFVQVASRRGWDEVNQQLMSTYLGRLRPTHNLRAAAERVTRDAHDARERVQRIYRFVCDRIESASGSRPASRILHRRMGDRDILLMALLRICGFDPVYVAARPGRALLHEPLWEIPLAGHFPLRLVSVVLPGGERLWLDTRRRLLGCGQLLEDTAGATAFLVGPGQGRFMTIPPLPAGAFGEDEQVRVDLAAKPGAAVVHGERLLRGERACERKDELSLRSPRFRQDRLEDRLAVVMPGAVTLNLEYPGLESPGASLRERYRLEVPGLVQELGGGRRSVSLCLAPLELLPRTGEAPAARKTPYHLRRYIVGRDSVMLLLPRGSRRVSLPAGLLRRTVFGYYRLHLERRGGGVMVRREYEFSPQRVTLKQWPRYLELAREIEAAESGRVCWGETAIPHGGGGRGR